MMSWSSQTTKLKLHIAAALRESAAYFLFHFRCLTFMFLRRGESRSRSVISSRQSTPNPSQMRDQELADEMYLSRNAYDAHGPYDVDFDSDAAGPSRPPPIPYDDPYGDEYIVPVAEPSSISSASSIDSKSFRGRSTAGSGGGYDRGGHHGKGRGRGRGRDRGGQRDRGRGGSGYRSSQQHMDTPAEFDDSQSRTSRPLTPTSFAIACATGQMPYNASQHQEQNQQSFSPMYPDALGNGSSWGYNHVQSQAQFQPQYGYLQQLQQTHMQAPLVQPHINPRFASAFGIAINAMQQFNQMPSTVQQQHSPQSATSHFTMGASGNPNLATNGNNVPGPRSSSHWTDEWKVDPSP